MVNTTIAHPPCFHFTQMHIPRGGCTLFDALTR
jgi:hypothetical protein